MYLVITLFLLLPLFFFTVNNPTAESFPREALSAHQYLNQIRGKADLKEYEWNPLLYRSATRHANYISANRIITHVEKRGLPHFSGSLPGDRAIAQGYATYGVIENFSSGQKNSLESIDGLMSAIYHRFGFLDLETDEIGIALSPVNDGYAFVYNMGNSRLNHACQTHRYSGENPFYRDICRNRDKIAAKLVDQIRQDTLRRAPPIVIWPPDGSSGILPAFYEEIPDPLPNQSVSGYPVSVQFNPAFYEKVTVEEFTLYEVDKGNRVRVSPLHLLQKRNDPNRKLNDRQFALFPLTRLNWGQIYQAELQFHHQGETKKFTWHFKTKSLVHPLFQIHAANELLRVETGKTYAVHIHSASQLPFMETLHWEAPPEIQTDIRWEDKNTILLTLTGETCQAVLFVVNDSRKFRVQISQRENLNPHHYYPDTSLMACVRNQNRAKQGFLIKGKGEILKLRPGQEYWVEINSLSNDTEQIRLHYPEAMQIDIKHVAKNVIELKASGTPGQQADFVLQNNKSFQIILVEP